MIDIPDRDIAVLVRSLIEQYGEAAEKKARGRARALADLGDTEGAEMWLQIAEMIARGT